MSDNQKQDELWPDCLATSLKVEFFYMQAQLKVLYFITTFSARSAFLFVNTFSIHYLIASELEIQHDKCF